ncbi:MAG: DUF1127 domain-containing protein [Bradyrhizobiaceae bacterium]|nr:DUF1127 domain-containing protein [Bradyrhizobiaceae bacterium]
MSSLAHCRSAESEQFALPFGGAFRRIARGVNGIRRAVEGRRMLRQLALADDRMLKDMGLTRSDLRSAAAEPLYRDPTELLAGRVDEFRAGHRPRTAARAEGRAFGRGRRPIPYY